MKISARCAETISVHSGIPARGFEFKGVGSKHQVKLTHRNFHHLVVFPTVITVIAVDPDGSFFCLSLDAEESNGQYCGKRLISFVDNCNNSYH